MNKSFELGRFIAKSADNQASILDPQEASKMLEGGTLRMLTDYIGSTAASRARAGRAQALAEASGQQPGFSVNYPMLSSLVGGLPGSVIGSATGSSTIAVLLGLLSRGLMTARRRSNINRIQQGVADTDQLQSIAPKSTLRRWLTPFVAPTHRGHTDVYEALQTGKVPTNMRSRDAIETLLGPIADLPVRMETGGRIKALKN